MPKLIIGVLLAIYFCFAVSQRLQMQLSAIKIEISEAVDKKHLIKKKDVRNILKSNLGYDISLEVIGQLDLYELERVLEADSRINGANLYVSKAGVLNIQIEQRKPIVRIDVSGGQDYYLDFKGGKIPISDRVRVPVVTGYVDDYQKDYKKLQTHNLNGILETAQKISESDFLTSLVEQIHIDAKGEITLVPKIGDNKILIGEATDLDAKFYRINEYYRRYIKEVGINKFDVLGFKFSNQVLAYDLQS